MKNQKNILVWIAMGITIFAVASHIGNLQLSYSNEYNYLYISTIIYIIGVLAALIFDCRIGSIIYICGIAIDIFGTSAISGELTGYGIAYGIGFSIISIIAFIVLLCSIIEQKSMRTKAKIVTKIQSDTKENVMQSKAEQKNMTRKTEEINKSISNAFEQLSYLQKHGRISQEDFQIKYNRLCELRDKANKNT